MFCGDADHREKCENGVARGSCSEIVGPVVADPQLPGVQSDTGLTVDRSSGGATSEELGEKRHVVRRQWLQTVNGLRTLKKRRDSRWTRNHTKLESTWVQLELGLTEMDRNGQKTRKTRDYMGTGPP